MLRFACFCVLYLQVGCNKLFVVWGWLSRFALFAVFVVLIWGKCTPFCPFLVTQHDYMSVTFLLLLLLSQGYHLYHISFSTIPPSHHSYVICPAVSTQITEVSGGEWVFVLTSTSNCMNFGCLKKPRFPFWDKHLIKRLFGGLMKTRDMHFFCFFFVTSLHFHLGWK